MMQLFCLQLEASSLQWSWLITVDNLSFFTYNWSFFAYNLSFIDYSFSFFAYSGKVRLIRALRDCKQRSLTVSKRTPTVSKRATPIKRSMMPVGAPTNTVVATCFFLLRTKALLSCLSVLPLQEPYKGPVAATRRLTLGA